jgi:outer membrane murein-binding lipoprotein Lpp
VSSPNQVSGALALVVVTGLLASGCGSGGNLDAKALSQESSSLKSLAAEGALLARDARAGRTTRIFRRVHSGYLYKAASQSSTSLRTAKTQPRLDSELRKLKFLAGQLSTDLNQLGDASQGELPGLARDLQAIAGTLQ